MVVPDQVSDDDMVTSGQGYKRNRLSLELEYPGQIKVNVIREITGNRLCEITRIITKSERPDPCRKTRAFFCYG